MTRRTPTYRSESDSEGFSTAFGFGLLELEPGLATIGFLESLISEGVNVFRGRRGFEASEISKEKGSKER
jgi:hypothetical protein